MDLTIDIYVKHARSLPCAQRMIFVHSLVQGIGELEPLLLEPQAPEDRRSLSRIIENSRHALRVLQYDELPVYDRNIHYEDNPPVYLPFNLLPVSNCSQDWTKLTLQALGLGRCFSFSGGLLIMTMILHDYDDTVGAGNGTRRPGVGILKAAGTALKRAAKKTGEQVRSLYRRTRSQNIVEPGRGNSSTPSSNGQEVGQADQHATLPAQRDSSGSATEPGV